MNVDADDSGASAVLQAAGLKVLQLQAWGIESNLSVLVCVTCEGGVNSNNTIVHAQMHGIKLTKQEISELNKLIPTLRLAGETKDFPPPPTNQAPVDYIEIQSGLKCHACSYGCRKVNAMNTHWSDDHRDEGSPDYSTCKVQTIFAARANFFVVRPILKGLGADDLYRLYLAQYESEIDLADKSIVPPVTENEIPPLLRVTLWHEHLAAFTTDKKTVRNVQQLLDTQYAANKTPHLGKPLFMTISAYMEDIKRKMKAIPIPARMLVMQYPV